jgi:hypothetical protein
MEGVAQVLFSSIRGGPIQERACACMTGPGVVRSGRGEARRCLSSEGVMEG